jgi:hypothetical protein
VQDFQLVLGTSIWNCVGERPVQMLEEALAEEKAKNGFDDFFSEPLAMYKPQMARLDYR